MGRLIFLAAWLISAVSVTAQTSTLAPPPGWTAEADADAMNWLTKAKFHDSNVGIAFDQVSTSTQPLEKWFKNQIAETVAFGAVSARRGVQREGNMYSDAFVLDTDGDPLQAYVFGYQTEKGKQMVMVGTERGVAPTDPVVQQALALVRDAYARQAFFADGKLTALKPVRKTQKP